MVRVAMYGKGGIGKSTMSSNLTAALSDMGYRVMQIGCDPKHDSTRLLLGGEVKSTILDYMKNTPLDKRRLEDILSEGYKGCLCAEAGGPEPGVGCAGRGIISSFDLLKELGGDSIERDVTLYDVLGDVVCGGFAVPLRNEYAEIVYIVSSGEFMSIYAANNILKGICNYDPNRVGGIIFNSRGDPEEKVRIQKFSEAVGIPIVASFERSELFMTAEENGKTVVEMYPESSIAGTFRELAENVMRQRKYGSDFLSEEDLERCILGRSVTGRRVTKGTPALTVEKRPKRKYASRNVMNNEPHGGCAFSGANSTCASLKGAATILHCPLSCAQFAFQTVSNTIGRYRSYHTPVEGYCDPVVHCTSMGDSDMIFGGTSKLDDELERCYADGYDRICVVTSCPSGIIGDDVRGTISKFEDRHGDVKVALVETDGNLNGDFMQGVIDSGIAICERFSEECEKTDTVNLIGTKGLALNCMTSVSVETELLGRLGIGVNCIFPAGASVESISRISSARMNVMSNPDVFTRQLCRYLDDRFSIPSDPIPVRPGIKGTRSWLMPLAEAFGKEKELDVLYRELKDDYEREISRYRGLLNGKGFCVLSATRDIDWILEAAESAGMERRRVVVIDRTDFSNDTDIESDYPDVLLTERLDIVSEKNIISEIAPDIVISTVPIATEIPQISIPLVQIPGPFTGVEFIRRVAATLVSSRKEGWRKDVVRS